MSAAMSEVEVTAAGAERSGSATPPSELPILPLRDAVLFPQAVIPLAVARPTSVRLVDEAVG